MILFLNNYNVIKEYYLEFVKSFVQAFEHMAKFDFFKIEKKDVLTSIDCYFESLVCKTILNSRTITKNELHQLRGIVIHKDFFNNENIIDYDDNEEEHSDSFVDSLTSSTLLKIVNCSLDEIPSFIKMTIIMDKEIEGFQDKNKGNTFASYVYEWIRLIAKSVDNEASDDYINDIIRVVIKKFEDNKLLYYHA